MTARNVAASLWGPAKGLRVRYQLTDAIRIELIGECDEPGRRCIENHGVVTLAVPSFALWLNHQRKFFKQTRYQRCDLMLCVTPELNEEMFPVFRLQ